MSQVLEMPTPVLEAAIEYPILDSSAKTDIVLVDLKKVLEIRPGGYDPALAGRLVVRTTDPIPEHEQYLIARGVGGHWFDYAFPAGSAFRPCQIEDEERG